LVESSCCSGIYHTKLAQIEALDIHPGILRFSWQKQFEENSCTLSVAKPAYGKTLTRIQPNYPAGKAEWGLICKQPFLI
jgi:hypothetical protein